VTRHVPGELQNGDWNTMVLHYLGLDHIGHKTGPRGYEILDDNAIRKLTFQKSQYDSQTARNGQHSEPDIQSN
jgi:hypothetical protein